MVCDQWAFLKAFEVVSCSIERYCVDGLSYGSWSRALPKEKNVRSSFRCILKNFLTKLYTPFLELSLKRNQPWLKPFPYKIHDISVSVAVSLDYLKFSPLFQRFQYDISATRNFSHCLKWLPICYVGDGRFLKNIYTGIGTSKDFYLRYHTFWSTTKLMNLAIMKNHFKMT
jgi:hypothetical protein